MILLRKEVALVGLLATASLAAVTGLRNRQAEPSNFKLYAYSGEVIGGFPIFYADGLAYVGNGSALTGADEVTAVNLTASTGGTWTATPIDDVSWSSKVFYISNTTGEIGFTDSANSSSNIITSGFRFYGKFALLSVSGQMEASWNAKETGIENVWTLGWGSVDEDSSLAAVMLRNAAPMQPPAGE
ncbi:hypothetical protein K458DRAFT_425665 [Lentithecium fluviatile CBS 122367]|uniref:Uncharacterized protein n=1 Tax=Lentithecium fluviatile CBS 122367 TaxID=1168545 RepID=A0A6G1JMH6_9PLEO|nr:hypothetical protein K458DRAFT_425665 [Lentithecium fluviatile CBS 122367]